MLFTAPPTRHRPSHSLRHAGRTSYEGCARVLGRRGFSKPPNTSRRSCRTRQQEHGMTRPTPFSPKVASRLGWPHAARRRLRSMPRRVDGGCRRRARPATPRRRRSGLDGVESRRPKSGDSCSDDGAPSDRGAARASTPMKPLTVDASTPRRAVRRDDARAADVRASRDLVRGPHSAAATYCAAASRLMRAAPRCGLQPKPTIRRQMF